MIRLARRQLLVLAMAAGLCPAVDRVVAVGDIHGAFEPFVNLLQSIGVLDKELQWVGGKTVLVQTGDVLDRGSHSRKVLDLLMDLMEKAPHQGGEARPLLGNHEVMVMIGDLRYVSPDEYGEFATPESEKLREKEYDNYLKYKRQRAQRTRRPPPSSAAAEKQAWMESHPPGYFEHRQAFAPNGKYGKWLRARDAVTQVEEAIFLHGGLSPESRFRNLKELNDKVRQEIQQLDQVWSKLCARGVLWQYLNLDEAQAEVKAEYESQQGSADPEVAAFLSLGKLAIISPTGPLWYRGYAQQPEAELAAGLDQVLKRYKARYLVLGHTIPPARRITQRFDGKVFLIDTGMLVAYFQGRPSALEMNGGHFKALYVGEPAQALGH